MRFIPFIFLVMFSSCSTFRPCTSYNEHLVKNNFKERYKKVIKSKYCKIKVKLLTNTAQSRIEGYIRDRTSGKGIVASVYLENSDKGTLSDSTGFYSLSTNRVNNQSVTFSSIGYDDFTINNLDFRQNIIEIHVLLGTTIIK